MYAMDAVKIAASKNGKSLSQVSKSTGHVRQYASSIALRGSVPRADTLADMLAACDYRLVAVPVDSVPMDALVIDSTRPSGRES